jgi:phosphopantetheinyl transferase
MDVTDFDVNQDALHVANQERTNYIKSITNKNRKLQSYFVWRLLEFALNCEGITCDFSVDEKGKWFATNNEIFFSLSHSKNIVAVSISNSEVGVDVENINDKILNVKRKFVNKDRKITCEELTILWTEKESKYKSNQSFRTKTYIITDKNGNKYALSVAAENLNEEQPICIKYKEIYYERM